MQAFTEKSMEFQTKIIERSGLGDETYLPDGMPAAMLCISPAQAQRRDCQCQSAKLRRRLTQWMMGLTSLSSPPALHLLEVYGH